MSPAFAACVSNAKTVRLVFAPREIPGPWPIAIGPWRSLAAPGVSIEWPMSTARPDCAPIEKAAEPGPVGPAVCVTSVRRPSDGLGLLVLDRLRGLGRR